MKALNIKKYPETVNGMKTFLFAQYINWFNKMIPASSFNFQYFMADRKEAIRYLKKDIEQYEGLTGQDTSKQKILCKSVLKRMNTKTKPTNIPCGSVGCFTGWSKECEFMFSDEEISKLEYSGYDNINTDAFADKVGMDKNLAKFIFMPDCFYRVPRIGPGQSIPAPFMDLGNASNYITKAEMLERCVKFLDYVVAGDIDPNPLADMSEEG